MTVVSLDVEFTALFNALSLARMLLFFVCELFIKTL